MTSTISGHYPLINPRPSYWIILPHSLPGSSSSGRRKTTQAESIVTGVVGLCRPLMIGTPSTKRKGQIPTVLPAQHGWRTGLPLILRLCSSPGRELAVRFEATGGSRPWVFVGEKQADRSGAWQRRTTRRPPAKHLLKRCSPEWTADRPGSTGECDAVQHSKLQTLVHLKRSTMSSSDTLI